MHVLDIFWDKRRDEIFMNDIESTLENKLSATEIKRILQLLLDKELISIEDSDKIDGLDRPIPQLSLSATGLIFLEKAKSEFTSIDSSKSVTKDSSPEFEIAGKNIPEKLFLTIFKNREAFQMFLELRSLTVKSNTVVADYSFIFHKMIQKDLKAINPQTTQPDFIKFLNKNFQAGITATKLPFKNPDNKQLIYASVLKKYRDNILK